MPIRGDLRRLSASAIALVALAMVVTPEPLYAAADEVTFTKDIAPILQRSCQNCHQPDSVAPMSLISYKDVRPWTRSIKRRTAMGPRAGVMPPWYIENDVGIQHYQFDPSLSDEEIAAIATWVDNGAPRGGPTDMPQPKPLGSNATWTAVEPDLINVSNEITRPTS